MKSRALRETKDRVVCATPSPGKKPTRIDRWKYEVVRQAILASLPRRGNGVLFRELPQLVHQKLRPKHRNELGCVEWYTTIVKLALEVSGEIKRLDEVTPQRLLRC